jgi:hypothetical protein
MDTRVVTATIAIGVVVAGVGLIRVPALRRVRWFVAAIDAYAAVAMVHAGFNGVSLHAALAGQGLLHALPRALQGACIAGFAILPVAWVLSVVRLGVRRIRSEKSSIAALEAIALTTCVALVVAALPRSPVRTPAGTSAATPALVAATLEKSLKAVAAGERATPRDHWDPDYLVARISHDPDRLFAWVQNHTYWIPYRGALRGPVGTLMDGQGNSLDRALLLATLLKKSGHTVRLAHGELTREQAASLLPKLVLTRSVDFWTPRHVHVPSEQDIRGIALQRTIDIQSMAGGRTPPDAAPEIESTLDARVRDQADRLLRAVGSRPADDWDRRQDAAITALRDHWWVQLLAGDSWSDLDLLAGESQPHLAVEQVTTTELDQVPSDLWHQVVIRVVDEHTSGRASSRNGRLEYVLRPADVIGQPIVLQFLPLDWTKDVHPALSPADVHSELLNQHEWVAGLAVGDHTVASALLHDEIAPSMGSGPDDGRAGRGAPFGSLAGAFENSMSNKRPAESQSLTAVWIEYEIRSPGEAPQTIRRTVLDLLGPDRRAAIGAAPQPLRLDEAARLSRSLALTMKTEILPLVSDLADDFVAHLAASSLAAAAGVLHEVASGATFHMNATDGPGRAGARPPSTALLALAQTRLHGIEAGEVFVDRLNLLTRHESLVGTPDGVALRRAYDIVANDLGVSLATRDGFAARLRQGVRDTNAEALLIRGGALGSTAEAFAVSSDWIVIRRGEPASAGSNPLSPDAETDLNAGYMLVASRAARHAGNDAFAGWWRINPETGATLGIGANGWGQAVEYGRQMNLAFAFSRGFVFEYALCQSFPLAMNSIRVINEEVFGGWNPSWTAPAAKSRDPIDVADENMNACIVQAIAAGFAATLPLILMTWRVSEPARDLALVKRALAVDEELEAARAGRSCFGLLRDRPIDRVWAFFLPPLAAASSQGCGPGGKGPGYGPNGTIVEEPDPQTLRQAGLGRMPTEEDLKTAGTAVDKACSESARNIGELIRYKAETPNPDPVVLDAMYERAQSFLDEVYTPAVKRYESLKKALDLANGA